MGEKTCRSCHYSKLPVGDEPCWECVYAKDPYVNWKQKEVKVETKTMGQLPTVLTLYPRCRRCGSPVEASATLNTNILLIDPCPKCSQPEPNFKVR